MTAKEVRRSLEQSSPTIDGMYSATIARILSQPSSIANRAMRTLLWTTYSYSPLTLTQLRYALTYSLEEGVFDEDDGMIIMFP